VLRVEGRALKIVRETHGPSPTCSNVPFVRTIKEAKQVTELLALNGLKSGVDSLKSS